MSKKVLLKVGFASILATVCLSSAALGSSAGGAHASSAKPAGTFVARIGWFYTDVSDFPQSKASPVVLHWGSCAKAGGVKLYFPLHRHIYEANTALSTKKPTVASLSGPPLNPKDPFKANVYVGDLATPGKSNLKMKCVGRSHGNHGKLVTKMTGALKTDYVRKDINFSPEGSLTSQHLIDRFGTDEQNNQVISRSCQEPGTKTLTLSSAALAAGPGGDTSGVLNVASDAQGFFNGPVTLSAGLSPGEYPAAVSCGSGRVGVGTIALLG